mgnify:FL=1
MNNVIVGLDSGYGYGIEKVENGTYIIENYIEEITKSDALDLASQIDKLDTNNIILQYHNKYYMVGTLCKNNQLDAVHRYSKDRRNIFHLIEILSLLGFASKESEFDVSVCLGLPNFLRSEKDEFEKWLQGTYNFSYLCSMGEIKKSVNLKDVLFLLQPYAPIFILPENKQNKFICSLDLGHGSADFLLVNNYKVIKQPGTLSYCEGVIRCYKQLKEIIVNKYANTEYKITDIAESKLQEIIETGKFIINDKEIDIKDSLNFVFEKYADYVFQQCESNLGSYLQSVDIFIASGGILNNQEFKQNLTQKFKNSYNKPFMTYEFPQMAIVNGYYSCAKLKYATIEEEEAAMDVESER